MRLLVGALALLAACGNDAGDDPSGPLPDAGGTSAGFIMNKTTGKIWGTSALTTKVYDESNASNPSNDL